MDRHTVTAFFERREDANNAVLRLRRYGVPDEDVTISPEAAATGYAEERPAHVKRYWAALDTLFGGTADHPAFAEAVRRGLVMVTAHVDQSKSDEAASALERYGAVDLSACETAWRAEGRKGGSAIEQRADAFADTQSLCSNVATNSKWDEAAASVLHAASAVDAYRTPTKPAKTASATILDDRRVPGAATCALADTRAEHRGRVRIHRNMIETFADVVRHHESGSEHGRDTPLPSEECRTSARGSAALAYGTTVQRAKNLEVVGSDGQHVGIIDHVAGTVIKLKCRTPASNGVLHVIPTMWVQFIDDKVTLKVTADDAMSRWRVA